MRELATRRAGQPKLVPGRSDVGADDDFCVALGKQKHDEQLRDFGRSCKAVTEGRPGRPNVHRAHERYCRPWGGSYQSRSAGLGSRGRCTGRLGRCIEANAELRLPRAIDLSGNGACDPIHGVEEFPCGIESDGGASIARHAPDRAGSGLDRGSRLPG